MCLLALCVTVALSALAEFADSLPHVPLTLGCSGTHRRTLVHTCTHTHGPAALREAVSGGGKGTQTLHRPCPAAAPDTQATTPGPVCTEMGISSLRGSIRGASLSVVGWGYQCGEGRLEKVPEGLWGLEGTELKDGAGSDLG